MIKRRCVSLSPGSCAAAAGTCLNELAGESWQEQGNAFCVSQLLLPLVAVVLLVQLPKTLVATPKPGIAPPAIAKFPQLQASTPHTLPSQTARHSFECQSIWHCPIAGKQAYSRSSPLSATNTFCVRVVQFRRPLESQATTRTLVCLTCCLSFRCRQYVRFWQS